MPLFPNVNTYFKGRTHTNLVVSEGMAPAEKYLPASSEQTKFQYAFGPEGNQNVVIPKGKVVSAAGLEWDQESERYVPAIKIADGGSALENILGVNHHNVYERTRDRFSGNQPTIITREYIEVPLFTNKEAANAIKFGAAWVAGNNNVEAANNIFGKYIAADEFGNFTVVSNGNYEKVIGQCFGVETDIPPAGYLQYFMEMDDTRWTEFQNQLSATPSPGRTRDAAWNDMGTIPLGVGYLKSKEDLLNNFRVGIPFLTDGYFRARTPKVYTLKTENVILRTSGNVTVNDTFDVDGANPGTVTDKVITCPDPVGAALFIRLPDNIAQDSLKAGATPGPEFGNLLPSDVKVFLVSYAANGTATETQVSPGNIHVDYTNNTVVLYLTGNVANVGVKVTATVLEGQIPGIPTGWDFKSSVGGARILLRK